MAVGQRPVAVDETEPGDPSTARLSNPWLIKDSRPRCNPARSVAAVSSLLVQMHFDLGASLTAHIRQPRDHLCVMLLDRVENV